MCQRAIALFNYESTLATKAVDPNDAESIAMTRMKAIMDCDIELMGMGSMSPVRPVSARRSSPRQSDCTPAPAENRCST
jgi:hypothetical protein